MMLLNLQTLFLPLAIVNIIGARKIEQQKQPFQTGKLVENRKGDGNVTDTAAPQILLNTGLTVIGGVGRTENQNIYFYFRGIPFAEPPIGELRFKPPVPLSNNNFGKTLYAINDSSSCLQSFGVSSAIGSEDCLYLNVYTPRLPRPHISLLPTMIWIYGGGFQWGGSTYEMYGPDYFMDKRDVIIVTFNYRIGILGFFSTGDNASPGNYGLKDQILALKWVKENIRRFGGNPQQVTIFGESAGAASVGYLLQTRLTKGLFSGAILESGTNLCPWSLTRDPRSVSLTIARMLNITTNNSQTLVDGLRRLNTGELLAVQNNINFKSIFTIPLNGFAFGPVVEPRQPNAVIVGNAYENLEKGLFQHVPILLGFNSLEAAAFAPGLKLLLNVCNCTIRSLVPASMNITDPAVASKVNHKIEARYFGPSPLNATQAGAAQYLSDNEFVRPILATARLYSKQLPPVYLYDFSYQGYLGSGNRNSTGVAHAEELPYIWRMLPTVRNATRLDLLTRKRLITLWTNFAVTGNPTPVQRDSILQNVTWRRTTTAGEGNLAYLDIGTNLVIGVNPNWPEFKWWNGLFYKYGNPPFNTY